MSRKQALFSLITLLSFSGCLYAQNWAGILDPTRAIDWSGAGVPGGIPTTRTQCGSTLTSPGAGVDATSAIQTALNGCGANHFVNLAAGTFRINSNIVIPSNVTLRGQGAGQTSMDCHGSSQACVYFGANRDDSQWPITSGTSTTFSNANQGATSITVANTNGFSVGSDMMLTQLNLNYMTEQGNGGNCNFCNGAFAGAGDSGQNVHITNIAGNVITFKPGLYINYTNSPRAFPFTQTLISGVGLESVQVRGNNTGYKEMIMMQGNYGSWVYRVETDFADNAHMFMYHSLNCEVRDSFFHDGFNHGPGTTDGQLSIAHWTSNSLVINSIFWRQHANIMFEWGSSGNVVAYNYLDGNYHDSQLTFMVAGLDAHGAHSMMNLYEGNVVMGNIVTDDYWGSNSHWTMFRDWATGSRKFIPPQNARGALTAGSAQWEDAGNTFSYDINSMTTFTNLVGVISGSSHMATNSPAGIKVSPASGYGNNVCNRFGYDGSNNALGPNSGPFANNLANTSMFKHGMYDCAAGTFTWDAGHPDHTLPASFFLAAKPSWWGSVPWPAIGPDVNGGTGPGGFAYAIPAQNCFNTATLNGTTNTGTFDPVACYAQQQAGPAPPENLTAVVQ